MGIVLKMQHNKILTSKISGENFKGENNFENITIYLPSKYNDEDILQYAVELNVINENGDGDVIILTNPTSYEDKYRYEFQIPSRWTSVPGKLTFWLKFIKDNGVVGLTNEVCARIRDTREIVDYIPDEQKSLLDELILKVDSLPDILEKDNYWIILGEEG